MGISRLLLLGLIAWFVYRTLKSWRIEVTRRDEIPGQPNARPGAQSDRFEPMARCAECGVHLPQTTLSAARRCGACERG